MSRPGDRLRAFAFLICNDATMARVIDPIVADLRWEHGEAVRRGKRWSSRWIRVAATFTLLKVMVATMDWTPDNSDLLARTAGYSLAAIAAVTMLFAMPTFLTPSAPQAYV